MVALEANMWLYGGGWLKFRGPRFQDVLLELGYLHSDPSTEESRPCRVNIMMCCCNPRASNWQCFRLYTLADLYPNDAGTIELSNRGVRISLHQ